MKARGMRWVMVFGAMVWVTQVAQATVLNFSSTVGGWNNTYYTNYNSNGYGDNVAGTPQGLFNYDLTYGPTPDVTVSVDDADALFVAANSTVWITNISPAQSVLQMLSGGVTNAMTFTISPFPTHSVTLRSFYGGIFTPVLNPTYGFSWLAAYVDGGATPAWTATAGDLTNFPAGGRFFQEGVTAGWTSGLLTGTNTVRLEWVANVGNGYVALGNIGFSEVPEPTMVSLLVGTGFVIACLRRRA